MNVADVVKFKTIKMSLSEARVYLFLFVLCSLSVITTLEMVQEELGRIYVPKMGLKYKIYFIIYVTVIE